jgi:3',5'-cyclic AMP phosphodiesterase CpdA
MAANLEPLFQLGLIADCQHADKPPAGGRTYRESLDRLALAVEHLNTFDLSAVLHLGDVIDGRATLEESLDDLGNVLASMQRLRPRAHEKVLHAIGNHDLAVPRPQLERALDLATPYYSEAVRDVAGWRLVILDTYQVTQSWVAQGRQGPCAEADLWLKEHSERPNALEWNGALGQTQRKWLSAELAAAAAAGERVLVFGHAPLLNGASDEVHCAWDGEETAAILGALNSLHVTILAACSRANAVHVPMLRRQTSTTVWRPISAAMIIVAAMCSLQGAFITSRLQAWCKRRCIRTHTQF